MAEVNEEAFEEEQQPVDPDLIDETDVDEIEATEQKPEPKKKRGRKKKKEPKAVRPYVETAPKQLMAKDDVSDMVNRYDWDSGDYDALIIRQQPQTWKHRNVHGYISSFTHAIDETFIRENFGGGVYDIKIRGPHPRTNRKGFLDGCRVKISGDPIISPMERDRDGREDEEIQKEISSSQKTNGEDNLNDAGSVLKWMEKREAAAAAEAKKYRERLYEKTER